MRRFLVFCWLILLPCFAFGSEKVQNGASRLVSPPLSGLGGGYLVLTMPAEWKIVSRDVAFKWKTRSYEFVMALPRNKTQMNVTLFWRDPTEAKMKGEMEGDPFQTASGLRGLLHYDAVPSGGFNWYLAIPVSRTSEVLVLTINSSIHKMQGQQSVVRKLYRSVSFEPSMRLPTNKDQKTRHKRQDKTVT